MKKLELFYIAGGTGKWYSYFGKWFGSSSNVSTVTLWPRNSTLNMPPKMKTLCLYKNLHIIVHSGIIHNIQKVETTQMDK